MSSRMLRKLQKDKDILDEISDPEGDNLFENDGAAGGICGGISGSGGARRKQLNINRYDLLNQQSHSESEVKEDDNETEAAKSCEGGGDGGGHHLQEVKRKKKKKKKKSGKHVNTQRSSEDNADIDEVERSVREVNRILGDNQLPRILTATNEINEKHHAKKHILSMQHRYLNYNNELKRIFGSKIVQADHKRKNRVAGGTARGHHRVTWMVNRKDNWPQVGKSGIWMNLVETKDDLHYFAYEHSQSYRQIQNRFLEAVESLNPDNIVAIINDHPYHVDALTQLSDLCKLSEDLAMAAELIERALYCLECAFHPLFNLTQGNCRLDYKRQENRALFVILFKHLMFVGGRACYRTALEYSKLLLSFDPDGDPLAIKLTIDFYALRAREYHWLIDFINEWEFTKNLSQLPNFAFSNAVAHFYVSCGDTSKADALLQDALLMFPGVLMQLLEKCSIRIDDRVSKHRFFAVNDKQQPQALQQLIVLYVYRCHPIWLDKNLLPWLEKNVHEVLDCVDRNDTIVNDYKVKRMKRYQGPLPRSIARHIILSDIKDLKPLLDDVTGPVFSFDPLPPTDSINIYNRTNQKVSNTSEASLFPFSIFFQSLLPTFSTDNIPVIVGQDVEGAGALPDDQNRNDGMDLQRSVASLVGAMRDLLNNIRPEIEVPNDADDDDDDDDYYDDLT